MIFQVQSGADLAMASLDIIDKLEGENKADYTQTLAHIHSLLPAEGPERRLFIAKSLHCTKTTVYPSGPPELHRVLAHQLWNGTTLSSSLSSRVYIPPPAPPISLLLLLSEQQCFPTDDCVIVAERHCDIVINPLLISPRNDFFAGED